MVVTSAIMIAPSMPAELQPRTVQLGLGKATVTVKVPLSKSETLRTDTGFVDVVVADPEVADVLPLTDRSLSVLGKKIGSTRLSIYAEGKQLLGVFDVEVSYDTSQLAAELSRQFPHASFRVSSVNGRILLSGSAPDGVTLDKAVTIAKQFGPEVINSVRVSQPQQVLLEVRFVEAARTAGRELGINWDVVTSNLNFKTGVGLLGPSAPFGVMVGNLLSGGVDAESIIRSLEERGVARRLAEPNLVALSGDTASFLAGGEFPFPVQSTNNTISIEFKKFGVGLAFTPTVAAGGVINLKIEPEVSQIDPTNSVRVGGVEIPSLIVRRANTTIELRDGQSFAVAGLLQSINETNQAQLPWIGNIPILGRAVPQCSVPEAGNRPRHHRDAAPRAADATRRFPSHAARRRCAWERRGLLPARCLRMDSEHAAASSRVERSTRRAASVDRSRHRSSATDRAGGRPCHREKLIGVCAG